MTAKDPILPEAAAEELKLLHKELDATNKELALARARIAGLEAEVKTHQEIHTHYRDVAEAVAGGHVHLCSKCGNAEETNPDLQIKAKKALGLWER